MSTATEKTIQEVTTDSHESSKKNSATNVRVTETTKKTINDLTRKTNKKSFGKRLKADHIISFALSLINDEHIQKLQKESMTSDDQEKYIFEQLKKDKPNVTWSEYKTLLLKGELTKFIKKLDIAL